ncbi:MAG: 7-cyano-7-deazaguanine synthase, partial [Candidatus Omnitrophota bacterium]|nr:7-cyano-7-deazaguanine synthase [Candidatus Omnitrophota bacterium]
DSGVLLQQLLARGTRIFPVYLRCGFRWEAAELYWLRRFLRAVRSPRLLPLQVTSMPLRAIYGAHWSFSGRVPGALSADRAVYLPGRNALLLSVAAVLCAKRRISTITLGTLQGNPFGDASSVFLRQIAASLTKALERPIRIETPLRSMRKPQVIRVARTVPLVLTFSCLQPRGLRHCGRCNKCAERRRAFCAAGVSDPTRYVH